MTDTARTKCEFFVATTRIHQRALLHDPTSSSCDPSQVHDTTIKLMKSLLRFLFWTVPLLLWDGIRLTFFVIALTPGFVRFAWYYFVAARRESIRFGAESCRQTLDVYSLESCSDDTAPLLGAPVLIFFTGGAWLIGYKMWGALLARALTAAGVVVVIPDMRNYPWASVPSMVEDVELSVDWTLKNIAAYGGDPSKVVLAGQSAGGHVVCTALLRMAMRRQLEAKNKKEQARAEGSEETRNEAQEDNGWTPTTVKGFVSLSAPYNLAAMQESFGRHGLDPHLIDRIFGGQQEDYDPSRLVTQCQRDKRSLEGHLPPIRIFHGTADKTAPCDGAVAFAHELKTISGNGTSSIKVSLYEGWSHTDPILEGPMDADHRFHKDLFDVVVEWTDSSNRLTWPTEHPAIQYRLCPSLLIQAGRCCMPF